MLPLQGQRMQDKCLLLPLPPQNAVMLSMVSRGTEGGMHCTVTAPELTEVVVLCGFFIYIYKI